MYIGYEVLFVKKVEQLNPETQEKTDLFTGHVKYFFLNDEERFKELTKNNEEIPIPIPGAEILADMKLNVFFSNTENLFKSVYDILRYNGEELLYCLDVDPMELPEKERENQGQMDLYSFIPDEYLKNKPSGNTENSSEDESESETESESDELPPFIKEIKNS